MRRLLAWLVLLTAAAGAAAWYYRGRADVVAGELDRRNDDRWLDDLQSRRPKDVERATAELEQRGTAAAAGHPAHAPGPVRRSGAAKGGAEGRGAFSAFARSRAVPDVAAALRHPTTRPRPALALSFMGSAAVPSCATRCTADEPVVRREALRSLGKLRERASIDPQIVVPLLLERAQGRRRHGSPGCRHLSRHRRAIARRRKSRA